MSIPRIVDDTSELKLGDGRRLKHLIEVNDLDRTNAYLRGTHEELGIDRYRDCIGWALFHTAVDVLLTGSPLAMLGLQRVAYLMPVGEFKGSKWTLPSLACISRSTAWTRDLVCGLLDRLTDIDVEEEVVEWPCLCGADCDNARRICHDKSAIELSLVALNGGLLGVFISRLPVTAYAPRAEALLPLFRQNPVFPEFRRIECLNLVENKFPDKLYSELYALSRFTALIMDGSDGHISQLPVDLLGTLGRTCRESLRSQVGTVLLFTLAGLNESMGGRDSIFSFLVEGLNVPVEGVNDAGQSIIEFALRKSPSFWRAQRITTCLSPASVLRIKGGVNLGRKFIWNACHILRPGKCSCRFCEVWRSDTTARNGLRAWLTELGWTEPKLNGMHLLDLISSVPMDEQKCEFLISSDTPVDLRVSDPYGNTALHLVTGAELTKRLLAAGSSAFVLNDARESPVDVSIRACDTEKLAVLVSAGFGMSITDSGLFWLASLCHNEALLQVFQHRPVSGTGWPSITETHAKDIQTLSLAKSLEIEEVKRKYAEYVESSEAQYNSLMSKLETLEEEYLQQGETLRVTISERSALIIHLEDVQRKLKKLSSAHSEHESRTHLENEMRECPICMEAQWDVALLCGHSYCERCAEQLCKKNCPTCSVPTKGKFIRLFSCRKV
jgi:hypothetical protein